MKRNENIKSFGTKNPRNTIKNKLIKKAVKKAFSDYEETYRRLAYE